MKYLIVIASLFLLNSGSQTFAQQIDQIHDIETRVVAICSDKPDTKNILGTGFIATKHGLVVTADHVIFNEQKNRVYKNLFCNWPTYPEPLWFRLSITQRFKQGAKGRDIALLQIMPDSRVKSYPFLEIGDEFEIGDPVLITGFPLVFEKIYHWPLFRRGIIASTRYKYQDSRVIVLDLPAVDGYSGSPVFNLRTKKVVGILKGGSAQRKGTDFSVAIVIEKTDLKNWGIGK
ncbi:MAG: serine protease [Desulfobulbaceae bacterium]|nr:serine protease [Desulfobulbaceae bacterium]